MKPQEIKEKSDVELNELEADLRKQVWQAKFDNHTNTLDDTSVIRKMKKDLARLKTVQRERELEKEKAG